MSDVAEAASECLGADKTLFLTPGTDGVYQNGELMRWLTLPMAQRIIDMGAHCHGSECSVSATTEGLDWDQHLANNSTPFSTLRAAVGVVRRGVNRAHILNSHTPGALLLELYTLDGIGTMVSGDLYEGTRSAVLADADAICALLQPLASSGVMSPKERSDILQRIDNFTVVERDGNIIACASLTCHVATVNEKPAAVRAGAQRPEPSPVGDISGSDPRRGGGDGGHVGPNGASSPHATCIHAELGAFTVHQDYRREGRGDSLLVFLEELATVRGASDIFLLTTNTSEWFEERGYENRGRASDADDACMRGRCDPERGSYLYVKTFIDE